MGSIPALNYTIRHTLDRLHRQHRYYEQELVTTRKLLFGYPSITTSFYGLVSADDPAGHVAGSSSPFVVTKNLQSPLTVDVNAGMGVFLSGMWLQLSTLQSQIALANTAAGVPNVVYIQYLLDNATLAPNDALQSVIPYTFRIGGTIDASTLSESVLLGSLTVTDYLSLSATVREDYIPLAIVTVQQLSGGGTDLDIDFTQASYSWNRPWFSPVDLYHRSQVGTGTISASNPHGTSGNDLTYTDFTALQVQTEHGMILAEDKNVAKVPGYRCEERTNAFLVDVTGALTGFAGATYVELTKYPTALGKCWFDVGGSTVAALLVPGTNLVVFPYEVPAAEIHVRYTRVEACEPPLVNSTTFSTNGPAEEELIIAGGLAHNSLTNTTETMGDAWQFPQRYDFFVDGEGTLLKTPQVVYCYKRLTDLTTDTPTITPYGPGKLQIGLVGAAPGFAQIDITVTGTDTTGATITQLFAYTWATWADPIAIFPNPSVTPLAFRLSTDTFATITSVEKTASVGAGNNAAIMIWMLQTPYSNYDKMKDACHVASTTWDGLRFSSVFDKRVISTTTRPDTTSLDSPQTELLIRMLAGGNLTVYCEDLRRPKYHSLDTAPGYAAIYPTYNLSKWQPGIHGGYYSAALPVNPASGMVWTVTLLGAPHRDVAFMDDVPVLYAYDAGGVIWTTNTMAAVPGLPGTYRFTLLFVPTRISVALLTAQTQGYVIYG